MLTLILASLTLFATLAVVVVELNAPRFVLPARMERPVDEDVLERGRPAGHKSTGGCDQFRCSRGWL